MKLNQNLGLILAGILVLGTAGPACAAFTGDFAPLNWDLTTVSGPAGSFTFSGTDTLNIFGGTDIGDSDNIVFLKPSYSSTAGTLSFSWTIVAHGNIGAPVASFYIDGTPYSFVGTSGTVTGVNVPANTPLRFELASSVELGKTPAELNVTSWEFTPIPEAGTWLAGILALGLLGFEALRRNRAHFA